MQIFVFQWEMAKKEDWIEQRTDTSYQASFDYFYGEQPITIEAEQGQKILFDVTWSKLSQGSIGYKIIGPDGESLPIRFCYFT